MNGFHEKVSFKSQQGLPYRGGGRGIAALKNEPRRTLAIGKRRIPLGKERK